MSYSALAGLWVVEDECLVGLFCSWEKAYDRLLLFMPLCLCCLSPFGAKVPRRRELHALSKRQRRDKGRALALKAVSSRGEQVRRRWATSQTTTRARAATRLAHCGGRAPRPSPTPRAGRASGSQKTPTSGIPTRGEACPGARRWPGRGRGVWAPSVETRRRNGASPLPWRCNSASSSASWPSRTALSSATPSGGTAWSAAHTSAATTTSAATNRSAPSTNPAPERTFALLPLTACNSHRTRLAPGLRDPPLRVRRGDQRQAAPVGPPRRDQEPQDVPGGRLPRRPRLRVVRAALRPGGAALPGACRAAVSADGLDEADGPPPAADPHEGADGLRRR
jgi:hypothetical protein